MGFKIAGIQTQVQSEQDRDWTGDNTGLSGVRLLCKHFEYDLVSSKSNLVT